MKDRAVVEFGIPLLSEESFDKVEVTERIHGFPFDTPAQAIGISSLLEHVSKVIRKDWTGKFRKNEDDWKGITLKKVYTEVKTVDENDKMRKYKDKISLLEQKYKNERALQIERGNYTVERRKSIRASW